MNLSTSILDLNKTISECEEHMNTLKDITLRKVYKL